MDTASRCKSIDLQYLTCAPIDVSTFVHSHLLFPGPLPPIIKATRLRARPFNGAITQKRPLWVDFCANRIQCASALWTSINAALKLLEPRL